MKHIIEVIQMEQDKSWMLQYFTPDQQAAFKARNSEIREGNEGWAKLIPEIEAAAKKGLDPASDEARALIERHQHLVNLLTGGDPAIEAGFERIYADKANWPENFKPPFSEAARSFIEKAKQAHSIELGLKLGCILPSRIVRGGGIALLLNPNASEEQSFYRLCLLI